MPGYSIEIKFNSKLSYTRSTNEHVSSNKLHYILSLIIEGAGG